MDLIIPPESFLAILGHLNERDRLRVLSTCRRMRVWLQRRRSAARAAFDAFKAQRLLTARSNWHPDGDLAVSTSGAVRHARGTRRWTYTVSLEEESGLISLVSTERFTMSSGVGLPALTTATRFFSPWFRTLTSRRGGRDTPVGEPDPDDNLQMLLGLSASAATRFLSPWFRASRRRRGRGTAPAGEPDHEDDENHLQMLLSVSPHLA